MAKAKAKAKRSPDPATNAAAAAGAPPLDIVKLRAQIDAVDARIHELLNDRARLARQVGISKHADGHTVDFYRPEREAQVLRMARERNKGPLRTEEILRLFREIMSACLAQEEPLKVGFLGPEGTFSQTATLKHFGHSVRALALSSVDEVFHEVEAGLADFGVVPVENSTEGSVNHTLDRLLGSPLRICGEVELRIHQFLMGGMEVARRRSSASAAIRSRWRSAVAGSTSTCPTCSASRCRAMPKARAARATKRARPPSPAKPPRMSTASRLLATEIEDRDDNTTRFFVVGRKMFKPCGDDRTTILCSALHTDSPGALFRLLEPLAEAQDQPDAHRVAPVTSQEVGLRVLLRHRRSRRRVARGQGARGAQEARLAVPRARFVSARSV